MPVSQSSNGLSIDLSKLFPVAAEAVRTFASIVEKGAATAKAFGAFATFVKEGVKREGRVRRFRDRVSGSLRCAGWCKYAGTRGAARFARTARFGLRGRRRPHAVRSGPVFPDALGKGIVLAGRQWALIDGYLTNPAAYRALLILDHCTPREAAKLFGELGGTRPDGGEEALRCS